MMSSTVARRSSSSEGEPQLAMDERKRKRMISNRESARRSRMRKQQRLDDLLSESTQLKNMNSQVSMEIGLVSERYANVESENMVLRAQVAELTDRLQGLNSVLHIFEEVSGMAMDIPEIPEQLLEPWQLPFPTMPIPASIDMFQC